MPAIEDTSRTGKSPRGDTSSGAPPVRLGFPLTVEAVELKPISLGRQAMQRFTQNRLAVLSLLVLLVLIVLAIFANLLPLINPTVGDPFNQDSFPSRLHLLGTDSSGHDLLSAILYGLRPALAVGIIGQVVATILGVAIGVVAGYFGGWIDSVLSRITDLVFALPTFLLAFLAVAVLGSAWDTLFGGTGRVVLITIIFGMVGWPPLMRFVRALTLSFKEQQFVEAAHSIGTSRWKIIIRHILPNTWGLVLVQATFGVGGFIYNETTLSLLGLGVQPPNPDLGALVSIGAEHIDINWLESIAPAVVLAVLVVAFAFLGDGLRDAIDPRASE
ncbi:MAG: transporter permease [Chloroflexi bacterium]|jgi:ABC-type dipeptide/oligopeptide/nickel transport system permease subunit|nr:transporter permease [Chloroflexota bacterium]